MSKKEKYDTSEDVRLGKSFFRAVQEEKAAKAEGERANKFAIYFLAFLGIILVISLVLLMAGGPK